MISPRQYQHYIISSLPFYAIFLGILFGPVIQQAVFAVTQKYGEKSAKTGLRSALFILIGTLAIQFLVLFGKIGNDEKYFEVIEFLHQEGIRDQNIILLDPRQDREQFESYLARYLNLSLVNKCQSKPCKEKMIKAKIFEHQRPQFINEIADLSEFEVWSAN